MHSDSMHVSPVPPQEENKPVDSRASILKASSLNRSLSSNWQHLSEVSWSDVD